MHLVKITGRGLKGGNFSYDLAQANVIVGDNFAGKTRVADAVRLLLIGYLPELGKLPRATFGLASGSEMEVSGVFSDGQTISRRWFLKGDTVKTEEVLPGSHDALTPLLTVMLNADEYFALSDRDRVNYVFANCAIKDPEDFKQVAGRIEKVAAGYELPDIAPDLNAQESLEAMIQCVAEDWKTQKAGVKQMEETVRGLTHLRAGDAEARPLSAAEDAKTALELAIADLKERKGSVMATYTAQQSANLRRQAIARELAATDQARQEQTFCQARLDTITRELAVAPVPTGALDKIKMEAWDANSAMVSACKTIEALATEHLKAEKSLNELDCLGACPYCGAEGTGWKALKAAEIATEIDVIQEKQAKAMEAHRKARQLAHDTATLRDATVEADALLKRLTRDKEAAEMALSKITGQLSRAKALEEERDRLPALDPEITAKVQTLTTELTVKEGELRTVGAEVKTALGRAGDLKRLSDAEKARDAAKVKQDLAAAAGKELRVIQAELVEAAFAPMLAIANRIFGGVLKSPLAYKAGEIGTWRGPIWIGHRTMSGTEKLLTYAAIQAALASKSPVKVMLLDEMGRLTEKNAGKVGGCAMAATIAGEIDQVLLIDPERGAIYKECNFNLIEIQ